MITQPLVSIIIPTYNRAHLIGETLDSVISQTYANWECIIVDDGSVDHTKELLEFYCEKDHRIQFHLRPADRHKGANACRNYGFQMSNGEYVNWFDSDDLMMPRKLLIQLDYILENNLNFCVAKFDNLLNNMVSKEKAFDENLNNAVNGENYTLMNIFWVTNDVIIARDLISDIRFNEDLQSGQEYNFFTKLLLHPEAKGDFLNETLSLRRLHKNSIQHSQKANQSIYLKNKFEIFYTTYLEIEDLASKKVKFFLIKNCQSFSFRLAQKSEKMPQFIRLIKFLYKELGFIKTFYFISSVSSAYITGKGFQLLKLSYPKD